MIEVLQQDYPWTKSPLISLGPMRLIALASLATEVSNAGGLGFIGAGSDASNLDSILAEVKTLQGKAENLREVKNVLPVGVGFLLWAGDDLLKAALPVIEKYVPAALWLYAAHETKDMIKWTQEVRRVTQGRTKIWIQIGSVQEAVDYTVECHPDVLVVQGQDAGGHGLMKGAGIISLFPEVDDALSNLVHRTGGLKPVLIAAGGIMDGRGVAAALVLGASGVCLGTRYLYAPESTIANGYVDAVVQASDGGQTTQRTKLYDTLRGTTEWPDRYGGRGVLNESYHDHVKGMELEENKRLYNEAVEQGDAGWTKNPRLTTYAGTGVGLVKQVKSAGQITKELQTEALGILKGIGDNYA